MLKLSPRAAPIPPRAMGVFAFGVVVTFLVMAGPNLDNAQQQLSASLGDTIEAIESGSLMRRVAMVAFAAFSVAVLASAPRLQVRPRATVMAPLTAFAAVVFVSPLWAIDPMISFRRVATMALMLLGVVAAAALLSMIRIAKLTLLFSSIVVIAAVLTQAAAGSFTPLADGWRLAGLLHPVKVGWYCGLGILASIAVARYDPPHRTAAIVMLPFLVAALVLTKTRTSVAATLAGTVVLCLIWSGGTFRHRLALVGTWLLLGSFLVALLFPGEHFTWGKAYASVAETTSFGRTDAVVEFDTFTGRLPVWEASIQLAADRPVLGHGYSAFSSPELIPIFAEASGWVPTSAHSGYIDTILSLGFLGLVLLVIVLLGAIVASIRLSQAQPAYAFAAAVLVWLSVNLAFEAALLYDAIFTSFLVFVLLLKIGLFPEAQPRPFKRPEASQPALKSGSA